MVEERKVVQKQNDDESGDEDEENEDEDEEEEEEDGLRGGARTKQTARRAWGPFGFGNQLGQNTG